MKQFENYFKNREEVEAYFKNQVFRFSFMSDNIMEFETLNPTIIGDELISFKISFYYEECNVFFAYSGFKEYLDQFQLSEVRCRSEETYEEKTMFFRKYKTQD